MAGENMNAHLSFPTLRLGRQPLLDHPESLPVSIGFLGSSGVVMDLFVVELRPTRLGYIH